MCLVGDLNLAVAHHDDGFLCHEKTGKGAVHLVLLVLLKQVFDAEARLFQLVSTTLQGS